MSQLITSEVLNSGKKFRLESSAGGTLREAKMANNRPAVVIMIPAFAPYADIDFVAEILPTKSINTNNQYVALKVSGTDLYLKHIPNQVVFRLTPWDDAEDNKALFAFYRTPSNTIKIKCVLDFPGNFWERGYLNAGGGYLSIDDTEGSDFNLRYFSSAPIPSPTAITVAAADTAATVAAQVVGDNRNVAPGSSGAAAIEAAQAAATQAAQAAAAAGDSRYVAAAQAAAPAPASPSSSPSAPFSMTPSISAPVPEPPLTPPPTLTPMSPTSPWYTKWWIWFLIFIIPLVISAIGFAIFTSKRK